MNQINIRHKGLTKKITAAKSIPSEELHKLITQCFCIRERVVGGTDRAGKFFELGELFKLNSSEIFQLVTSQDINQDSMSFASNYIQNDRKDQQYQQNQHHLRDTPSIPENVNNCLGNVMDLDLFEQLLLQEGVLTTVVVGSKAKIGEIPFKHFYFASQSRSSVIVYVGSSKICEFYLNNWDKSLEQVREFIQGLLGDQQQNQYGQLQFQKRQRLGEVLTGSKQTESRLLGRQKRMQQNRDNDLKSSFLQNLTKLMEEGELSQLQFYKMKTQLLENTDEFIRKYRMGSRTGLRTQSRQQTQSKQENRLQNRVQTRVKSSNRNKRYQIPIIVRKYNNVVQKISTSYPLTIQQEQAINLILQLQLKGLITQKQAGQTKSMILHEDQDIFKLFRDYFQDKFDQIQLAGKLRRKRSKQDNKQMGIRNKDEGDQDMRLLVKFAKQSSYQVLRKLLLEQNKHIKQALRGYRQSKNGEQLVQRLQRVAVYYRMKQQMQQLQDV